MITTRAQGLLHFDPDEELATKECLPAKRIVVTLPIRLFYILVSNILKRPLKEDKHQVLGCLTYDIDSIIKADLQKAADGLSPRSVINAILIRASSTKVDFNQ